MARRNARNTRNMMDMKRRKDPAIRKMSRLYMLMALLFFVFIFFNMMVEDYVHANTVRTYDYNLEAAQQVAEIRKELSKVNQNVLVLSTVENPQQKQALLSQVTEGLATINNNEKKFLDFIDGTSEDATRRFKHTMYALSVYESKIKEIEDQLLDMKTNEAIAIYTQELNPLWIVANEMIGAVTEIVGRESAMNHAKITKNHLIAQSMQFLILFSMIAMLMFFARKQVQTLREIQNQNRELNEASARLTKSRKKLLDSAMTNILTGMKNRYALDESLSQLINNAQFNIAVFDVDNFRNINDMYGYEVGDEYLATIAERLKEEYSEYAEMFNITGNEFCMIFYEHVSDIQAQQLAEQIRIGIGQPTMVAGNLVLQTSVSASLYHYLPSDNLDVNTLLMRMDSALHAAKRDGGNRMYQIQ